MILKQQISPQEEVKKLFHNKIKKGFSIVDLYRYSDNFYRVRFEKGNEKFIRPMHFNGNDWKVGEPDFKSGKPLYFRPIEDRNSNTVYLVEGEKCVDVLHEIDLSSCTSGGASSAGAANWEPLRDKKIVIWPDNDVNGFKYAKEVFAKLHGIAASVEQIDVDALNLPNKGDCVDWLDANPRATKKEIESLGIINVFPNIYIHETEEPQPLKRELPPSPPYPIDALGEILGDAAKACAEVIQAPLGICGQSFLAAAALACQGHADLEIDGRVFPISEFFLSIGQSGERKSAVDKWALKPHRFYQEELRVKYEEELKKYHNENDAYKKSRDEALKKNKSFEEKKKALNGIGDPPEPPLLPYFIVEEPTYEGLIKLLLDGQPSQGLFSDEGARFIGGHGMSSENELKTAAGFSGLWDGKPISRVRAGDGSSLLVGRRVSFHLMLQPQIAQTVLSNSLLMDQGLLSRCLVSYPLSTAGTRLYRERNLSIFPEIEKYELRVLEIYRAPLNLAESKRNELTPPTIKLSLEAKKLWIAFHNSVEKELSEKGNLYPIKGLANKIPEHAARLASILVLFDNEEISNFSKISSVDIQFMKSGIALAQYHMKEALRLFEAGVTSPGLILAEKALGWFRENNKKNITLIELYQSGPNQIREANTARMVMNILEDHGWALRLKEGLKFNGVKRKEAWRIRI